MAAVIFAFLQIAGRFCKSVLWVIYKIALQSAGFLLSHADFEPSPLLRGTIFQSFLELLRQQFVMKLLRRIVSFDPGAARLLLLT